MTDYTYNNRGWLTRKDQPDPDGTGPLGRPYSLYGYDSVGHLTSLGEPGFMGAPLQFTYDSAGRQTGMWYQGDTSGTSYTYDNLNRLIKVVDPLMSSTSYTHNWRGQVTQVSRTYEMAGPGGAPTLTTLYEYDPAGQLTVETDPRGAATKYVYDARGLLSTVWLPDPDGEDPTTTGPEFRSWVKYVYDDAGRLTRVEDLLERHADYVYNNRDWITEATLPDPDGSGSLSRPVLSASYDQAGRMLSLTDPLGHVTSATYDNVGRILSVTGEDPDDSGPLSAPVQSYTYNALGSLLTMTDPGGNVTSWQYDYLQRPTQMTEPDPDGSGSLTAPVTVYEYGSNTLLSKVTDPLARDTTLQYDARGRRTGVTDELGHQTTYTFNLADLITQVTAPDPDGGGPLTAPVTTYAYDYFRRLTAVSQPGGGSISYSYDAAGNLLSLTDPVGNQTTYAYDGLNRLTIETNESGDWRSYDYDLAGNLSRVRDRNGRVLRFYYDQLDQLTSQQWRSGADPGPELAIATTTQGGTRDEVQRVGYTTVFAYGGTFTLSFAGQTTSAISYNATAAAVQSALEALSNIAAGDVVVTKLQDTSSDQQWKLEFQVRWARRIWRRLRSTPPTSRRWGARRRSKPPTRRGAAAVTRCRRSL